MCVERTKKIDKRMRRITPRLQEKLQNVTRTCTFLAIACFVLMLIGAVRAHGQTPNVVISELPPEIPQTTKLYYDGSNRVEYICRASGWRNQIQWSISGGTLINVVVSAGVTTVTTSSAHGITAGSEITISGSSTTSLNTTFTVTTVGSSTTMALNKSMPDGTYAEQGLRVTATQPRTSAAIWTIQKFIYSGSNLVSRLSSKPGQICDNRAVTGTSQIAYQ